MQNGLWDRNIKKKRYIYPTKRWSKIAWSKSCNRGGGAGTGLGVNFLVWDGFRYIISPSEGSHFNFAPSDKNEEDIREKYKYVSMEKLLSGSGIIDIYSYFSLKYLIKTIKNKEINATIKKNKEASKIITKAALEGKDEMAIKTIKTFVNIYGSAAGDLAYIFLSYDGIYIVGSISTIFFKSRIYACIYK